MADLFNIKPISFQPPIQPEITKRYPTAKARAEAARKIITEALLKEGFGSVLSTVEAKQALDLDMGEFTLLSIRCFKTEWDDSETRT